MTAIPPPYAPRDSAQVQGRSMSPGLLANPTNPMEFTETTSVCLEWKLTGLKATYDATKGESKSKVVKSAVFGDADNMWEILWYPNSGIAGGEFVSLYLSCVPTAQEKDQGVGNKWTRKGLWWFRFEIKSLIPDDDTGKIHTLATKDAHDHTFAVKTANWGWQQFVKRDSLFGHPLVQAADAFMIICTIHAQAQPPAGYWLGLGMPPSMPWIMPNAVVGGKTVGSGGGLSAWSGGGGASSGVAGGVAAGGGVKKVVPKDLISAVGSMLDDPLYSDVEFVIPMSTQRRDGMEVDVEHPPAPRRIYASKKLLVRCDYFQAMFNGGFREVEGEIVDDDSDEDDLDTLSDSDVEDEAEDFAQGNRLSGLTLTTTTSHHSDRPTSRVPSPSPPGDARRGDTQQSLESSNDDSLLEETAPPATGRQHVGEQNKEDDEEPMSPNKREVPVVPSPPRQEAGQMQIGPKKTKVVIKDAAWATWWAVLFWIYTDVIYFAPLSSSFPITPPSGSGSHSRSGSASVAPGQEARSRRHWIQLWTDEHGMSFDTEDEPQGPRPVSAKAVYRLADKLDLPALKIRAFQHICSQLTPQNIPAEVFSRFSSTFDDIRKVQIAYFLKHWSAIKKSDSMTMLWQQIRTGKHVGFEEVWPLIVGQLEFKQD